MNINLLHLRYFYTVAVEGGFTRASEKLRIAQPSLSRMVKELEESLGHELLVRSKKLITLTDYGRVAFKYAQEIFDQVGELEKAFSKGDITSTSPQRIGTSDLLATEVFPGAISKFSQTEKIYPFIQIGTASELCELILKRSLDYALLFHAPEAGPQVMVKNFQEVSFHLVIGKKFLKNEETRRSFIGSREVDETTSKKFPTLSKWREKEPKAQIKISTNSLLSHLSMVKEGLGVAVLPSFLVSREIKQGHLVDLLPQENLEFKLKLLTHRDYPIGLQQEKFLEEIKRKLSQES